jgi:predicted nucleotidyltransferase
LPDPTPYPDLNALLRKLVAGARSSLADNFCGAYLQGSFALGDADRHSDVDFIVATRDEVTRIELAALQQMHEQLYAIDVPWAQHLEGSYVPVSRLRRVDPTRAAFLYLDNGASELIWDNHCNTAVVRWTLREHGVVLAGPDPKELVDPVSSQQLRSEVLREMREWVEYAHMPTKAGSMSRWLQPLLVLSYCRMLHTLASERVTSKREAGEWALDALDPGWAALIQRALDDRPDPWLRVHQPAEPEVIERTLEFIDYAVNAAVGKFS